MTVSVRLVTTLVLLALALVDLLVAAPASGASTGKGTASRPTVDRPQPESGGSKAGGHVQRFLDSNLGPEGEVISLFKNDPTRTSVKIKSAAEGERQWFDRVQALGLWDQVAHFISAPSSDSEFHQIFRREPKPGDFQAINIARSKISASAGHTPYDFHEFLRTDGVRIITIIGHNDGGRFMFPNGGSIHLSEMARQCALATKVCVFLSCNSANFVSGPSVGVRRPLDYERAINIANRLSSTPRHIVPDIDFSKIDTPPLDFRAAFDIELERLSSLRLVPIDDILSNILGNDANLRLDYLQVTSGSGILVVIALAVFSNDQGENHSIGGND